MKNRQEKIINNCLCNNWDNAPCEDKEIFDMANVGNRITVTNGTTENYTTNELNQYTAIDGEALTYDMNGNMTYDGYNTISYDYTNRPIYFDNPDYEVEIRYDALGRRVEKRFLNKAKGEQKYEAYVLDGNRVLSDIDENGGAKKSYVWENGVDELIATAKGNGGKFDYYLTNHLGNITQRAASDPFTQIVSQSIGVGPFCCLLRGGLSRRQTLLGTNPGAQAGIKPFINGPFFVGQDTSAKNALEEALSMPCNHP